MGTNISLTTPYLTVSVVDPVGFANGNTASSKLGGFNIYQGKVLDVNYLTKQLTVNVNDTVVYNCAYIAGTIASLLGVSTTALPLPGTNVLCLFTPMQTFVIGIQPSYQTNNGAFPNVATTAAQSSAVSDLFPAPNKTGLESPQQAGYPMANDLLPGEEEISNNMAVTLRFLSNILLLDTAGLALIEQCMLNDMVRIVDQYFVHHNCGGDTLIWNNGRCNYEDHFTSYPTEASGQKDDTDPIAELADAGAGVYTLKEDDDPYDATGRWRKSTYIGFLGDMVHYWITNPTSVISTYAEGAARAGQFRTWVGADGTLMVQAAGDIMIEATSYMVIPLILHKWDNPELNKEDILKDLNSEYLKIWGKGKDSYWTDMNASVWLMRQYLRYITIWHSLSRFRLMSDKEFCSIPVEKDSAVGNKWADEQDKKDAGVEVDDPKPYRTVFRCSPDGSLAMLASGKDGMSSIILNQGNILLSAANNVEIKACGTISLTGNSIAAKARRVLELISLGGKITQRARTAWNAICEAGRVWLKGDVPKDGYDEVDSVLDPEFKEYSVIVDSSQGKTLVHGAEGTTIGSTNPDAKVTVEALNGGTVNLYGMNILIDADKEILNHTISYGIGASFTGINSDLFNINNQVKLNAGAMLDIVPLIRTNRITVDGSVYARDGYIGPIQYVGTYKEPMEHAGPESVKNKDGSYDVKEKAQKLSASDVKDNYPETEFSDQLWSLGTWYPFNSFESPHSLKMDYWNDAVQVTLEAEGIDVTRTKMALTTTMPAPRTDSSTAPWPGKDAGIFTYETVGAGFTLLMEQDYTADDLDSASSMKLKPLVYIFNNQN